MIRLHRSEGVMMTVEYLKNQALKLSLSDRALLAEHLLASLDDSADSDVESAWVKEARRRREAFQKGEVSTASAESAITAARAKLH